MRVDGGNGRGAYEGLSSSVRAADDDVEVPHRDRRYRVSLIGQFEFSDGGDAVFLPHAAERLLAFLALSDRPRARSLVAATLWPDVSDERACANLRTTLFRIRRLGIEALTTVGGRIWLADDISLEHVELERYLRRLAVEGAFDLSTVLDLPVFSRDLLEGWTEEWLTGEQERWRLLRVNAVSELATWLLSRDRYHEAGELAMRALEIDPYRENLHQTLIAVFVAVGARGEAVRHLRHYQDLLRNDLGIEADLFRSPSAPR